MVTSHPPKKGSDMIYISSKSEHIVTPCLFTLMYDFEIYVNFSAISDCSTVTSNDHALNEL